MSNYNEGYQTSDYQGAKLPSAPSQFHDYPAPSYDQATAPIIHSNQPNYQAIPIVQTQVILVGGCPACRFENFSSKFRKCFFFSLLIL